MKEKVALITGVSGQDGAYLSKLLLNQRYKIIGLTRSYSSKTISKLKKLGIENEIIIEECDLLDYSSLVRIFSKYNPSEVYNLASQSSVGVSFHQPIGTLHFNIISVINLLEIIREFYPSVRFYQATSSEMFGNIKKLPITEDDVFNPQSPYAISKASAHWLVKLYRESYNLFTCNGILFNHESILRDENFFIKKLVVNAVKIKLNKLDKLILGNIDLKRDFGYSPDYVRAMYMMLQQSNPNDYLICSGKSISLRSIVEYTLDYLQLPYDVLEIDKTLFRPSEIEDIYGLNEKARKDLNWNYEKDFFEVIKEMIDDELNKE